MKVLQNFYAKLLQKTNVEQERIESTQHERRIGEVIQFFTEGYQQKLENILPTALHDCELIYSQHILIRDIDFVSLCEHHLLPMFGKCHIAYLPCRVVLGLGKITEIVTMFSRRLQLQERLTDQIAQAIFEVTQAEGVAVKIEAKHFCMALKGLDKLQQTVVTQSFAGECKQGEGWFC